MYRVATMETKPKQTHKAHPIQDQMVRLRQEAGLTREQLARHVGVSLRTLASWEREEIRSMTKLEDCLRRVKEGIERAKTSKPELSRYKATELVLELLERARQMDEILGEEHELERVNTLMPRLRGRREADEE